MMSKCRLVPMLLLLTVASLLLCAQQALQFDGVNDNAEVHHDRVFELANQMTVEVMFHVDQIPTGDARIVNKKLYGIYDTFAVYFRYGELRGASYTPDLITGNLIIPGGSVPMGVWNHVAMTYDGARRRFFLNGAVMDSSDVVETIANEAYPVSFGRYDAGFGQYFEGGIDEARLWSVARTGDEIRSAMNVELTGEEPGLVGYWKFNEGVGDSIHDSSIYGNNGRLGSTDGPDANDPAWIPHDFPPPFVDLLLAPTGPTTVPIGGILSFNSLIVNTTGVCAGRGLLALASTSGPGRGAGARGAPRLSEPTDGPSLPVRHYQLGQRPLRACSGGHGHLHPGRSNWGISSKRHRRRVVRLPGDRVILEEHTIPEVGRCIIRRILLISTVVFLALNPPILWARALRAG
jgi:hypothetical protein